MIGYVNTANGCDPGGMWVCKAGQADVQGIVAEGSALRLSADVPEEVLQRCIKTSKACHSFQVVRGVALRLFACFDAGKCKWNAVRCSLLDKAKRGRFPSKSASTTRL